MEKEEILKALEKLGKGGKVKTKAVTYEYEGSGITRQRVKTKEVVTTKEFLPDKSALNKIMEIRGLGSLEDEDKEEEFEV